MSDQVNPTPAAPVAPSSAPALPVAPADDAAAVRAELLRDRFEAVAARAGLDEDFLEEVAAKAERWLADQKLEPSKPNLGKFLDELKGKKPKLFAASSPAAYAPPANTAPVVPNAPPAVPAPASVLNPYAQWRALRDAGRVAEAEAFYRLHRGSINRNA